jgi:hypothetical protein
LELKSPVMTSKSTIMCLKGRESNIFNEKSCAEAIPFVL